MKAKAIKFYRNYGYLLPTALWWVGYGLAVLLQGLTIILLIGFLIILALIGIITNSKRIKKIADKIFEFIGGNIEVNDE